MTRREVVLSALRYQNPPYVPWHVSATQPLWSKLQKHFGPVSPDEAFNNHMYSFDAPMGRWEEVAPARFRDPYGVMWDRTVDKDIGTPCEYPLAGPSLDGYRFPAIQEPDAAFRNTLESNRDKAVQYGIGFSLFERAWTLRGMERLLMDFIERPDFVHELLDAICEQNLTLIDWGLQFNPDMVHFGDDWGQQRGLIMGPQLWREFIKPRLKRMYARVRNAGKIVSIHSCGDVDELFDELIGIGLNLFNPFQPEVMDIVALRRKYHGQLAFHGGLSIQKVLPFGTPSDVQRETRRLLRELGSGGGYILAPSHAMPHDIPVENVLAFMDVLQSQPGFA